MTIAHLEKIAHYTSFLLLVIITALSLLPVDELPDVDGSDKLHHFIAYCAVILPISVTNVSLAIRRAPAIIIYSGLIEIFQPMSNRYAEWADFGVNTIGIICGVAIGWLMHPFVVRFLKPLN